MDMKTFFDIIIFTGIIIFLLIGIISFIGIFKLKKKKRYISISIFILSILGLSVIIWGSFFEPNIIKITRYNIENQNSIELKLAIIADPHLGPFKDDKFLKTVVEKINYEKPDIVLLPGDFIYHEKEAADNLYPLKDLKSKYGAYAVLGNHDYGVSGVELLGEDNVYKEDKASYVEQKLEEYGVTVLRNENLSIDINGQEIFIAGAEDLWSEQYDFNKTFEGITKEDYVIFLEHNPDIIEYEASKLGDIIVSGHTHGGQVRLPIIGALTMPVKIDYNYDYGVYYLDQDRVLLLTKGLGEIGPRARFLCSPEIMVVEI